MTNLSQLLEQHQLSNFQATDENGDTILHLVMKNERFTSEQTAKLVKNLLKEGVDPNIKNRNDQTVLHLAIAKRAKDVIELLLACEVKLDHLTAHYLIEEETVKYKNLVESEFQTSDWDLFVKERESANFVEWIVTKGLNLDNVNNHCCVGPCVLLSAIENNLQHVIPTLTKYTKDINFIEDDDSRGSLLLFYFNKMTRNRLYHELGSEKSWYSMYTHRNAASIVEMMLDRGVSTEVVNEFENTALHEAILEKESINIIEMLIRRTLNINRKNREGKTPFYLVIYKWLWSEKPDVAYFMTISRALIAKGADVNEPSKYGWKPLSIAVQRNDAQVIEFLRDSGAVSLKPEGGAQLMMHQLVNRQHQEIDKELEMKLFKLLIDNGCPVSAEEEKAEEDNVEEEGSTPLHAAVKYGNEEIVRKLIEHGADVDCKNAKGQTPLHYVCESSKRWKMARFLIERGADVNATNSKGDTPLHLVAVSNRSVDKVEMLKLLLGRGADMSIGCSVVYRALLKELNRVVLPDTFYLVQFIEDRTISDGLHVLLLQWIKLSAAGLYQSEGRIENQISELVKLKKYKMIYENCLKEIAALKSTLIDDGVSFYNFLRMNSATRCIYVYDEKLKNLIDSSKVKKQFPEYSDLILYPVLIRNA